MTATATNVFFNNENINYNNSNNNSNDNNTNIDAVAAAVMWNPSMKPNEINKKIMYIIDPDDFIDTLTITPYTVFEYGGVFVKISGLRLYMLLTMPTTTAPSVAASAVSSPLKRSKRNVCMRNCDNGSKQNFVDTLTSNVDVPPCIKKILCDLGKNARGGMHRKRFIFNCYILNVVSCTKCSNKCMLTALTHFYCGDSKCTNEVMRLMYKSQDVYKPPNCEKMKTVDKLCANNGGKCKGLNMICNF
ncbi:ORF-130 [Catopsilia pomona nucleopolyhedrovirus]|uniref:ORF-130 n=1 Tax=Catopsilia pomona nucleopolyhedrovirus TaxID=1850906 RepID=A0A172WZK4_9ABAC|nr:ORF-130 [Catopsilia pomona nucleopolyhedrovirus]ANF29778.1 ORF-130 [Catopsilia pomona nucleopolyhedrovirus]